ncbi:YhdP family protein [Litorivicinus lipolyticus]|uniref:YhdP family phospholipid transporter n=1 Tax=Litorivicinus lipolyticus TaxID=418701 RepID=UPI003B5BFDDB
MAVRAFLAWLGALVLLVFALVTLALRLGSSVFPDLTDALLRDIHARAGVLVQASDIHLTWRGGQVALAASDIQADRDGFSVRARNIELQLDLGASLNAGALRFAQTQFEGLVLQLPDASGEVKVDPKALLGQLLVPLAMADQVQLLDAQISGQNFALTGLNGRLSRTPQGASIRVVGQAVTGQVGASFSANLLATDQQLTGFVKHKARASVDGLSGQHAVAGEGEAWIEWAPTRQDLQWRGTAQIDDLAVSGALHWQALDDLPWRIQARDVLIDEVAVPALAAEQTAQGWRLSSGAFDVANWPTSASALLPPSLAERLDAIAPTATVESVQAELGTEGVRVAATLKNGHAHPLNNIPGGAFERARIWLHNGLGMAEVDAISEFQSLAAFDDAVAFDGGAGRVAWRRNGPRDWSLASDTLSLRSSSLNLDGRFRLDLSPAGPELGLLLNFDSQGAPAQGRVPLRYLGDAGVRFWQDAQPQAVAGPSLLWLFLSPDYPNQLTLEIPVERAQLTPVAGWPAVTDAAGTVRINDADIRIDVAEAAFGQARGDARIRRRDRNWQVQANARMDGADLPTFIARTPLDLAAVGDAIAVRGPIQGALDLTTGAQISGHLDLATSAARVEVRALDLIAEQVAGTLNIDLARGLQPSTFKAMLFERAAHIELSAPPGLPMQLDATATVPLSWASRRFVPALVGAVKGRANTRVSWNPKSWSLSAAVAGGQLNLPEPIAGRAGTLYVEGAGQQWQSLSFADRINLVQQDGRIEGSAQALNALAWAGLMAGTGDQSPALGLDVRQLQLGGISLGAARIDADARRVTLAGPHVDAAVEFGPVLKLTAGAIKGRMLNPDTPGQVFSAPAAMPDIDIAVKTLEVGDNRLYNLATQVRSTDQDVLFNGLSFTLGGALMQGSARWSKGQPASSADLRIETQNLGELMADRGWGELLETRSALLDVTLDWPGVPWSPNMGQATGVVSLDTTDGRFLDSPGAADALRLLGVLNIASLTRRLRLDFSDLLKPGLAFDRISGQARLRDGQLDFVEPLSIDGPSASLQLTGTSNLATDALDHRLRVQVPLSAQLPAAALLAGFPAIAAGIVLLVDQVAGDSLKRIGETNYTLTGTFDAPVINAIRVEQ